MCAFAGYKKNMRWTWSRLPSTWATNLTCPQFATRRSRPARARRTFVDARDLFIAHFIWPGLKAGAVYENAYYLATALGRPLIAKLLVDVAREEGAQAVAHGSTGKGNDQVRFDVSVHALAPELQVIAPVREWGLTRDQEEAYAKEHGIPVPDGSRQPYSLDQNLWGRSIESGPLEDPWVEPPENAYEWTVAPENASAAPAYVEIGFEEGIPTAIDGREMSGVDLIQELNDLGGAHGVGRVDHVENRGGRHQVAGDLRMSGGHDPLQSARGPGATHALRRPVALQARRCGRGFRGWCTAASGSQRLTAT